MHLSFGSHRPVNSVVSTRLSMRKVWGSIPGLVKSNTMFQRPATAAAFLRTCLVQALSHGDGPRIRYTFRRNTASIMKICFIFSSGVDFGNGCHSMILKLYLIQEAKNLTLFLQVESKVYMFVVPQERTSCGIH